MAGDLLLGHLVVQLFSCLSDLILHVHLSSIQTSALLVVTGATLLGTSASLLVTSALLAGIRHRRRHLQMKRTKEKTMLFFVFHLNTHWEYGNMSNKRLKCTLEFWTGSFFGRKLLFIAVAETWQIV